MRELITGALRGERPRDVVRRSTIIAIVSFLTLINLFGSQALLPLIVTAFATEAGTAGLAVNAVTLGMAVAGLAVAYFADRIDRKQGIWMCLALLAIPTALLAITDSIWVFMVLRIVQGMLMAAAFTLSMTYLSEQCDVMAVGGAMAAYITGNVASNLLGRLLAVSAADLVGLSGSFLVFAALNLMGAAIAFALIGPHDTEPPMRRGPPIAAWRRHWSDPALRAAFTIGFLILFVFVGVFTYVNLVLVDAHGVSPMLLGVVYVVFVPALFTTPLAGNAVRTRGPRRVLQVSLGVALAGLLLTLAPSLWLVLAGMAIVGAATFFAQAAATGFVSRQADGDQAAANGLYLTGYYVGGLAGALLLGQIDGAFGWRGTVAAMAVALAVAIGIGAKLQPRPEPAPG